MVYCSAVGCSTYDGRTKQNNTVVGEFNFPTNKRLRSQWYALTKRDDIETVESPVLCGRHFTEDSFQISPAVCRFMGYKPSSIKLKSGALPTLFLHNRMLEAEEESSNLIESKPSPTTKRIRFSEKKQKKEVPNNEQNREPDPEFAHKTIPDGLVVKKSKNPGAGLGVFATRDFPVRTRFGPYGGKKVKKESVAAKSRYCWQIFEEDKPSHFVDASDPADSNWMRYVNCARSEDQQCVTAYQYKGEIYYRSHRPISAGMEILVHHGDSYARDLGLQIQQIGTVKLTHNNFLTEYPQGPMGEADGVFQCRYCPHAFDTGIRRDRHMWRSHGHQPNFCFNLVKKYVQNCFGKGVLENNSTSKVNSVNVISQKRLWDKPGVVGKDSCCSPDNKLGNFSKTDSCNTNTDNNKVENREIDINQFNKSTNCNSTTVLTGNSNDLQHHATDVCDSLNSSSLSPCNMTSNGTQSSTDSPVTQVGHNLEQNGVSASGDGDLSQDGTKTKCDGQTECRKPQGGKGTHLGDRRFKCLTCGKAFFKKWLLRQHERIHTGLKPYICSTCGAAFTLKGNLQKHEILHTGEKPHKCSTCGAAFTRSSHLQIHKRIHTGEKPYKCSTCGTAFTRSNALQTHKRIHTGEKPYKCSTCGAAFTQSQHLQRHKRIHTGPQPVSAHLKRPSH